MLLKVKKQIEETLEVKTPCYYKGLTGYYHINEAGQFIQVGDRMICQWSPTDGHHHTEQIERMLQYAKPCTKEEFDKAYAETMDRFNAAVGSVVINS
jgi:uncharacterized protein (DUF427 family)